MRTRATPSSLLRSRRHDVHRRAGFSLVELMVALGIGGLAITSMYAIAAASTRTFQQQHQLASTQSSLRTAMELVKRDVARAGFLSTPNATSPGQSCSLVGAPLHVAGNGNLAAISRFADNVDSVADAQQVDFTTVNAANGFTADDVVLFGNYETASEYPGVAVMNATQIAIDQDWHSFAKDFTAYFNETVTGSGYRQALFNKAFALGRVIRLRAVNGQNHFAEITAVTHPDDDGDGNVLVTFAPGLPTACLNDMNGGTVAPVSFIRYFAQTPTAGTVEAPRFSYAGQMAQLVRREVDPDGKLGPLSDTAGNTINERRVLDYLVAFNLAFTLNDAARGQSIIDSYVPGNATATALQVNATPERVRAIQIVLAARAPLEDPTFPWDATTCGNLRCYQALPDSTRAARVRVMRAEVFLPNIAFEGY